MSPFQLDYIGAPAFTVDVLPSGVFRYAGVNAANTARSGFPRQDVRGRTPHDLFDYATAAFLNGRYYECARSKKPLQYKGVQSLPAGLVHWRTYLTPLLNGDGDVTSLLSVCEDISDIKQLEGDLATANAHLKLALRALKGAVWRYDVAAARFDVSPDIAILMGGGSTPSGTMVRMGRTSSAQRSQRRFV